MKPKLKEGITIFKNEITALGICLTYETLNNLQYDFIYTHTFIGKNHISGTIPKSPEQLQIKADFEYEKLAEKLIFWNIRSKDDESIALSPEETTILFNCTKLANISLSNYYEPSIEVKIMDVTRKLVGSSELIVRSGKAQLEINELSNGVYILQVKNATGQVANKRLVITR